MCVLRRIFFSSVYIFFSTTTSSVYYSFLPLINYLRRHGCAAQTGSNRKRKKIAAKTRVYLLRIVIDLVRDWIVPKYGFSYQTASNALMAILKFSFFDSLKREAGGSWLNCLPRSECFSHIVRCRRTVALIDVETLLFIMNSVEARNFVV